MIDFFSYIRWQDGVDILVVSFVIYQIFAIIRGSRSVQMIVGLGVLFLVYSMATLLDLSVLTWIMQNSLSSIFFVIIIVFQQDIRRALTQVGQSPFQKQENVMEKDIDEIIRAVFYLSKRRIGALIVMERENGLGEFVDSGTTLDAKLSRELLISIFLPVSPLHDGGVLIVKGKVESAGSILPLTQNPYINKRFGTRHRAAIGISEETDAVVIVVSEETQEISIVQHGALTTINDEISLKTNLKAIFFEKKKHRSSWLDWIGK
ncbi:MAG: diadenylate cyclase CdaA [Desulfotalea sp.]